MSYKIALMALVGVLALALPAAAQEVTASESESGAIRIDSKVDSSLVGRSIFSLLPSKSDGDKADVKVHQSQSILKALDNQIVSNSSRTLVGFRVRIFNDNKQSARNASEAALGRFKSLYPGIPAYRSFSSPFFKVTVGDFRSKSEASRLLMQLATSFPSAFIVREVINYPIVSQYGSRVAEPVQ